MNPRRKSLEFISPFRIRVDEFASPAIRIRALERKLDACSGKRIAILADNAAVDSSALDDPYLQRFGVRIEGNNQVNRPGGDE